MSAPVPSARDDALARLAADVYVAGFPLVVSTRTLRRYARRLGPNRLDTQTRLSDPRHRSIVAPNRDTLYALAALDLRGGPVVFEHPPVPDRYFSIQLMDMWTESFASIGTRTGDADGGVWLITPPGWRRTADVPPGVTVIESPTPQLFLLGRYLVDSEDDVPAVAAITRAISLSSLAADAPGAIPDDATVFGRPQEVPADARFFDELDDAIAANPPYLPADVDLFARWRRARPRVPVEVLERVAREAVARTAPQFHASRPGGWRVDLATGTYGSDIERRARVARVGWAANVPEESVYGFAGTDAAGVPLDGRGHYRITFPPGDTPPVDAFWSLSVYGADMFFAEHPSGRYSIGDRTPDLTYDAGGALVIDLAHARPSGAANWLPVPNGPFVLMLRLYLPGPRVLDGTYPWPPIERLG